MNATSASVGICLSSLLFVSSAALAAFTEETIFYDLPEVLEPNPIPTPTAAMAALPGYPNHPDQLTLAARLYLSDVNIFGSGPYTPFHPSSGPMAVSGATRQKQIPCSQAWHFIDHIERAWHQSDNPPPMAEFVAGSWGLCEADDLLLEDGNQWRRL